LNWSKGVIYEPNTSLSKHYGASSYSIGIFRYWPRDNWKEYMVLE